MAFHTYLLRCADGSYYCGHTDDMAARMRQHEDGLIGYTSTRKPVELVWQGDFETREEALAFELRVKGWSRAKKEALIAGDWQALQRLAWGTRNPLPAHLVAEGAGASIPQPERQERASMPQPERQERASIPQPERQERASIPQPERQERASIPQPERQERASIPQPERQEGASMPQPERQERASMPQPERQERASVSQPERQGWASISQPERVAQTLPGQELGRIPPVRPEVSKDSAWLHPILTADRRALAKAITLLESTRADHRARADELLNALLPHTGRALRLGISGVPGVGKSTFIEALGLHLIAQGHKVAVLAVDPSSSLSGGSILGDKTRMEHLSAHPSAYIRPSPSSGTLGGVAEKTREAMLVFEAAGYDVVIVETVGVGQSETAVAGMTDLFVLLQLPNAGDDLQAIKRGVMELADLVVINKADLDPDAATRAQAMFTSSLRLLGHGSHGEGGPSRVMKLSALKSQGVDAFWREVQSLIAQRRASGEFASRRQHQGLAWMWDIVHARLLADFHHHPAVRAALPEVLRGVNESRVAPSAAARQLLQLFTRT